MEFVEAAAADWRGTADRALRIGSSHTLGGTPGMLDTLAEVVPKGRLLAGAADRGGARHLRRRRAGATRSGRACGDAGWQVLGFAYLVLAR
ncbi:MAG: hypothetical protein ACJ72N_20795 [Labedaea sp.]